MKTVKILAICMLVAGAFCFGKVVGTSETKMAQYPELAAAKKHLNEAKANLQKAAKDYDGHRTKAIEHTEKAVKEIDEAILYADKQK